MLLSNASNIITLAGSYREDLHDFVRIYLHVYNILFVGVTFMGCAYVCIEQNSRFRSSPVGFNVVLCQLIKGLFSA